MSKTENRKCTTKFRFQYMEPDFNVTLTKLDISFTD